VYIHIFGAEPAKIEFFEKVSISLIPGDSIVRMTLRGS